MKRALANPAFATLCWAIAASFLLTQHQPARAQTSEGERPSDSSGEAPPPPKKKSAPNKNKTSKRKTNATRKLPGSGKLSKFTSGSAGDRAKAIGTQIGIKVGVRAASMVAGSTVGAALGGITAVLGFIGDAVQRDKCKLGCCPPKNLKGSWACKYQDKRSCNGHYSDYPGHGDHACWWNDKQGRCEVGIVCRDKTFNFFALVGSVCPPCPNKPVSEPQWSAAALKKAGLPKKFYVDPKKEYLWCAPKGAPGRCSTLKAKARCEESYADNRGDKNCVWRSNKCTEGPKCDNARERLAAAKKLGLKYSGGAWRRNGKPVSYASDYQKSGAGQQTGGSGTKTAARGGIKAKADKKSKGSKKPKNGKKKAQ